MQHTFITYDADIFCHQQYNFNFRDDISILVHRLSKGGSIILKTFLIYFSTKYL